MKNRNDGTQYQGGCASTWTTLTSMGIHWAAQGAERKIEEKSELIIARNAVKGQKKKYVWTIQGDTGGRLEDLQRVH